jgi:hypothetical protein
MPALFYSRISELTDWMKHSSKSVFDVLPGPFPEKCNIPVTDGNDRWYIHFLDRDINEAVISDVDRPADVTLMRTGVSIPYHYYEKKLRISLAPSQRTDLDDVVMISWDKPKSEE